MNFLTLIPIFILGTIIGSFLNVVIYRYNSGTSPLKGRSQCFACGKTLHWYELVPVFSFLAQRARCRGCGVRLSWQYPVVEALTGVMFVSVFLLGKPLAESIYLIVVFSTLLIVAVYDMRHQIIPDGLVALFAALSLGWFLLPFYASYHYLGLVIHFPYYWTLIAGPMLFFPFWLLWFVSDGRWLGLGDGKLALGIGWFLGATLGGSAVMLGFWIGALYALAIMAIQRVAIIVSKSKVKSQKSKKSDSGSLAPTFDFVDFIGFGLARIPRLSFQSEIPFGPFLILGTVIVYFTHINFFDGSINLLPFL